MRPFRELDVWKASHAFALEVYEATQHYPTDERFGLTSQMRRAAVSIPANIAEGSARGDAEMRQFLRVALGSAAEVEYFVILSHDLRYLPTEKCDEMLRALGSVKRMRVSFRKALTPRANGQRPGATLVARHEQ